MIDTPGNLPRRVANCMYEVFEAKNGWIFAYYDIATDTKVYFISKDPEELGSLITAWQAERVAAIIKWTKEKVKT